MVERRVYIKITLAVRSDKATAGTLATLALEHIAALVPSENENVTRLHQKICDANGFDIRANGEFEIKISDS
jgi:hypothetical protein